MFSQFFGKYLLDTGKITDDQFNSCMEYIKANRVQLGLIAETEGMLTRTQANELNYLQMQTDKLFGDLAVEKGYLTTSDITYLLGRQGNPYLIFVQALKEGGILSCEESAECLAAFQRDMGYSNSVMNAIKDGNIEQLLPAFVQIEDEKYTNLISLTLRCIVRFVSSYIRLEKGSFVKELPVHAVALQRTFGDYRGFLGFCSDDRGILKIADGYAKEEFDEVNEDSLDAVAEFTNCVNGLFAAELSFQDIHIDMEPPEYHLDTVISDNNEDFYALPIYIEGQKIHLIIKIA